MFHKMRKEFVYFYSRQIPYYLFPPPGGGREYYRLFEEIGCHFSAGPSSSVVHSITADSYAITAHLLI